MGRTDPCTAARDLSAACSGKGSRSQGLFSHDRSCEVTSQSSSLVSIGAKLNISNAGTAEGSTRLRHL